MSQPKKTLNQFAHDLDNPLLAIRGFAQLIEELEGANPDVQKYVKEILEACSRMQKITQDMRKQEG